METMLILTYSMLCWAIFKIFKIPINKWSVTTAVLGGVVLVGHLFMGMAYFHPGSRAARIYYITTPVLPNVRGLVTEVPVKANEKLKKGDVLFRIDPTPYEAKVESVKAELDFARQRLEDTRKLMETAGGSRFEVLEWQKKVATLEAKLKDAMFDLNSCTVHAPSDGYVTHVRVRPGQMAVPFPVQPMMTFVNPGTATLIGGFSPEPIGNIKPGQKAEVVFKAYPGMTFRGKVRRVLPALAEGELSPDRKMATFTKGPGGNMPEGLIPVIIDLDKNISSLGLPLGVDAEIAVFAAEKGYWSHVGIIRKILLRMITWSHFLRFH